MKRVGWLVLADLWCGQALAQGSPPAISPVPPGTVVSDDGAGLQGFGPTAIENGHLNIQKVAGLVIGTGQTAAVQAANGTLLQKAFSYCDTSGVECDEPDAIAVEFNLSNGLSVPASSNGWRGRFNKRLNLRQAAVNAPVLVIGDPTGATNKGDVDWDGATLNYINDQTGQTGAVTFLEGSLAYSKIANLTVSSETLANGQAVHPGYDGWDRGSRSANGFSFTNSYTKITVSGAQASLFRNDLNGTGNYMEDVYFHNGGSVSGIGLLSDTAIYFGGNGRSDDVCMRCNFEHFISNTPVGWQTVNNMAMIGTHVEDVGTPYILFSFTGAQVNLIDTKILNFRGVTANAGQSSPATANNVDLFRVNYGAQVHVDGVAVQWDGSAPFTSTGSNVFAGLPGTEGTDSTSAFVLENLSVSDTGTNGSYMGIDPVVGLTLDLVQKLGRYEYSGITPSTIGAVIQAPGSATIYPLNRRAVVVVPSSISAAETITLADTVKASGTGSTAAPETGETMEIVRQCPANSNTVTIKDAGGTTLATPAVCTRTLVRFNGRAWASAA